MAPNIYNHPHTITAKIVVPMGGAEGVIVAWGANAGGHTMFVKDGKVNLAYNYEGHKIFRIEGVSIGYDYGDTVDHVKYTDSFPFSGTVKTVTYDVSGEAIHDAEAVARRLLGRQ